MKWRRLIPTTLLLGASAYAQCPPPVKPTLPPDGAVTAETRITFVWSPAGSAVTGYDLVTYRNGGEAETPPDCFNSSKPDCIAMLTPGRYEWFVRNYREDCAGGTASPHFCFRIEGCNTPVAPTRLAPDGITVPPEGTTLSWTGGTAETYDVFLQRGKDCTPATPAFNTTPLTGTSMPTGPLQGSPDYAWRVRASGDASCPRPEFSPCVTFKVKCVQPGEFTLDKPTFDDNQMILNWSPASGAQRYSVYLKIDGGPFRQHALTWGWETSASIEFASPCEPVDFEWYVQARCGDYRTDSPYGRSTIPGNGNGAGKPRLDLPKQNSVVARSSKVEFRWNAARNATQYQVWLLRPDGRRFEEVGNKTAKTVAPAPTDLAAGVYYWYVEAENAYDCPVMSLESPGKSETWKFEVDQWSSVSARRRH